MAEGTRRSGIQKIEPPPSTYSSLQKAEYFLNAYEEEFYRARRVVKTRANLVTIWTSIGSGVVSILGALSAGLTSNPWSGAIGVLTSAVGALVAVLVAWDGHFKHKDLWIQRSQVLGAIQGVRLRLEMRKTGSWRHKKAAEEAMTELQNILDVDLDTWIEIRRSSS